ncbi:hypothetical protein N657DRAFT_409982 [Parathielavia appendiculata]|uniref:Uncharacterized protein n=1 Tax=Parathielavia appendiculata TaxID=2587402 RepID=A0AAN6U0C6_9PEZI|nr:hypothetical protein N657DRAFT_409982 [Parathielavia appendiculata]
MVLGHHRRCQSLRGVLLHLLVHGQLAQLLLAQVDFRSPGMYDSIATGSLEEKTRAVPDAIAIDSDLHSVPWCAEDVKSRALLPPAQPNKAYKWAETAMEKRVSGEDIQFLANVLNPLSYTRFTTGEILESEYLNIKKPQAHKLKGSAAWQ